MEAKMTTIKEAEKAAGSLYDILQLTKKKHPEPKRLKANIPPLEEFKGKLQKGITIETLLKKKLLRQIDRILKSKELINVLGAQQGSFQDLLQEIKALIKEEKHKKVTHIDKSLLKE
jgi:hypothetical protein